MRRVPSNVLIVGGGLAAQRAAETLRSRGHHGPIRVVCGEPVAPYDRPPLSKDPLCGASSFRPASWYDEQGVELVLGRPAARLEPARRRVLLADGEALGYDALILATGSHPRRIPALAGRPNVHVLRTAADAAELWGALAPGARLAIIGAGFIGQEVAAAARGIGVEVTLLEAAPVPLAHVLGPRLGAWFAQLHREAGVRVELGTGVSGGYPEPAGAPVRGLVLEDGRRLAADAVLVAVGVAASTRWLAGSPLAGDGVEVDAGGRTAVPGVLAAGDLARRRDPVTGRLLRCEHWEPAARMGADAARTILGLAPAPAPPESFWSDQYGIRIQLVGEAAGADAVELDGEPSSHDFTAAFTRGGRLTGALLVGRPRELGRWRRRLAETRDPATERSAA